MKKTLCIFPLIRRISYDGNTIAKYFQYKSTTLVATESIFLCQRKFSNRRKPDESNTALKTIKQYIVNKDYGKAFDLYDSCQQRNVEVALDDVTALTLTLDLLRNNRIADARQIVNDLNGSTQSKHSKDVTSILHNIFTALSTSVDNEEFAWFADRLIFTRNSVQEPLLGYLLDIALNDRNDVQLGIQIFTKIATERKKVPWLPVLLMKCINSSNSDDLKTVVQVASSVIGQKNIRFNLAFAYVEVGYIKEAENVFNSLEINDRTLARVEQQIEFRRKRRDKIYLANLLAASKDCIPRKCRVRIFEALFLLHQNDIDQIQTLCQQMGEENLKPKTDMEAIQSSFYSRNIKIPKYWQQSLLPETNDESNLCNLLDTNQLDAANALIIDRLQSNKRLQMTILMNVIRKNVSAGNVHGMKQLRAALPDTTKSRVDFYSNECRTYMCANRHLEYVGIIQWEIKNRQSPNLPSVIIDLIMDSAPVYDHLRKMIMEYNDEDIGLICLLWAHNFINDVNLEDNDQMWSEYLESKVSTSVGMLSEIFYQQHQFDRLREFLNSNRFEKHRVKPFQLGKSYSYLFEGFLEINDHSNLMIELKLALNHIEVTHLDTNIVKRIQTASTDCEAIIASISSPRS